jgi:hypothetical protein
MAVSAGPVRAATLTYTNPDAYFAVAGPQTVQDFDRPISSTATSVTFPNLVVSCSGSDFCNATSFGTGVFGEGIFFASPSTATFTFDSPITSFGITVSRSRHYLARLDHVLYRDRQRLLGGPVREPLQPEQRDAVRRADL